ncbi:hypothetical protein K3495_g12092 [Podosphaera aphanis]|nr:hypothetical protein K3495_g12092 [Podosphaera aphanis]
MKVELYHTYHTPYIDIELSDEILGFINELVATRTPAEIYQSPQDSNIPGAQRTVQHQVVSATRLLEELGDKYSHEVFTTANLRALAIYIHASISNLAQNTKEIAIDATFGTNNAGMDLFAVLAEFDGTGTPLAYLFIQKIAPTKAGAMTQVFVRFMEKMLFGGLDPSFIGCDKDKSEINAIQEVWPSAKVQLCFWHAKRATRAKLHDSTKTESQKHYFPSEAKKLVPSLEIFWGSHLTNRFNREHRHIVHCFEDFEDSIKFFGYVRRQRTMPFWVDRQLVLRPEFQASFSNSSEDNGEVSAFEFDSDETETVEDSEDAYLIAEDDDDDEATNCANTKAMMLEAIEICEQQNALGNTKFVKHSCMKNASNQTLVEEIQHINNQHTMPKTWGPYKHPSSMYHIPVAK